MKLLLYFVFLLTNKQTKTTNWQPQNNQQLNTGIEKNKQFQYDDGDCLSVGKFFNFSFKSLLYVNLFSIRFRFVILGSFVCCFVHFVFPGTDRTRKFFAQHFSVLLENNYKLLREHVEQATLPAIPFLGVYVKDMIFINDGNEDTITVPGETDGETVVLMNWGKMQLQAKVIQKIRNFQKMGYSFAEDLAIMRFVCLIADCFCFCLIGVLIGFFSPFADLLNQ